MDFNETYKTMQEALSAEDQRKSDLKKKAIAAAKGTNASLANVPDDQLDYDEATNTVKKIKLNPADMNKLKSIKIKL